MPWKKWRWRTLLRWTSGGALVVLLILIVCLLAFTRPVELDPVAASQPPTTWADPSRLELLTYNVFVRPAPVSFGDATTCRSARIGEWLSEESGADVVVLTETFQPDDVTLLSSRAKERFPYQALSLPFPETFAGVSGGLSLLSRWPIEELHHESFDACSGTFSDCLATKGVVGARIQVAERASINVIGTHLDAGEGESDREARALQLAQLREFVRANFDLALPTFLLGDFNVDGFPGTRDEYPAMMSALEDLTGRPVIDAVRASAGVWAADGAWGRLFNTMNCRTTIWCDADSPNFDVASALRRRLDYVLALDGEHAGGRIIEAEHVALEDDSCGSRWLSDHKAVRAVVELDTLRSAAAATASRNSE